jgi:hypothetical protein
VCLLGNATRNLCGFSDLANTFIGQSLLHSQVQLFHLYRPLEVSSSVLQHSCTAIPCEVSSALLGAQLSLALVGYELLYLALGLNKERLVEGLILSVACKRCFKQFVAWIMLDVL